MSASTARAEQPGTEIQLSGSVAVGTLPPEFQQALEMRKLQNQIAGQLASINWGKQLDLQTRRAVADWGQQFRVDTTIEINVLGGNVYLNAYFYLRQLAEMIAAGLVDYAFADHIEHDERLAKLGAEGDEEITRRLRARIRHGVPDKAASAVVFRVKLHSMSQEVVGVKWCGNGTRKNDPVGDDKPVETSESRAARRAMRLISSHVPPAKREELEHIERSAEILSQRIAHARNEVKESNARIDAPPPGRSRVPASSMPLLNPADPYSEVDTSRTAEMETAGRPAPVKVVEERFADASTGLATPEQKARIAELLNDPKLDLAEKEIERIASEAGKRDYTADRAATQIAQLERLLPKDGGLFGEDEGA